MRRFGSGGGRFSGRRAAWAVAFLVGTSGIATTGLLAGSSVPGAASTPAVATSAPARSGFSVPHPRFVIIIVSKSPLPKLPNGTVGKAYAASFRAKGGLAPYHWKIASGKLPAGLKLSAKGTISGKPTQKGTSSFVVQASDSEKPVDIAKLRVAIAVK